MQRRNRKARSADSSSFLPARFDWSIMGCTILLLALMNLEERRGKKREKHKFKSSLCGFIKHKDKTVLRNLMATLATDSLREASATKQANKRAIVC